MSTREVGRVVKAGFGTVAMWVKQAGVSRSRSKASRSGDKAWNWKGGVVKRSKHVDNADYRNWRFSVFERDGFECKRCGCVGGKLNAHHILKWSKYTTKRYDIDNGITLCESCHKQLHRKKEKIA